MIFKTLKGLSIVFILLFTIGCNNSPNPISSINTLFNIRAFNSHPVYHIMDIRDCGAYSKVFDTNKVYYSANTSGKLTYILELGVSDCSEDNKLIQVQQNAFANFGDLLFLDGSELDNGFFPEDNDIYKLKMTGHKIGSIRYSENKVTIYIPSDNYIKDFVSNCVPAGNDHKKHLFNILHILNLGFTEIPTFSAREYLGYDIKKGDESVPKLSKIAFKYDGVYMETKGDCENTRHNFRKFLSKHQVLKLFREHSCYKVFKSNKPNKNSELYELQDIHKVGRGQLQFSKKTGYLEIIFVLSGAEALPPD